MIYNVTLYFNGVAKITVEAKDEDRAEELAMEELYADDETLSVEVIDAVVTVSDNQYTDEQELRDGERRHGIG